jgi:TRAP-type C4-dicarboxylate transport system permease large subunit
LVHVAEALKAEKAGAKIIIRRGGTATTIRPHVGIFLDGNAAIVVLTPLPMPTVRTLGIMMIANLSIGAIAPPFGTTMFLTCKLTKIKVDEYMIEIVPYY